MGNCDIQIPRISTPARLGTTQPDDARWTDFHPMTHSSHLDPLGPATKPLNDLGVRLCGVDYLHGRFCAGTSCSSSHLLWYVVRGTILIDSGNGSHEVKHGQVALSPVLYPHWVRLSSRDAKGLWFHLYNTPRWGFLSDSGPCIRSSAQIHDMEWLMDHTLAEASSDAPGAAQNALHYTGALAVLLQREWQSDSQATTPTNSKLDRLWVVVSASIGEAWSVERLAASAGLSPRYLHKLCMKRYGIGPMGLVTRMRMDHAMELLVSTNRKLDDIAPEVGYGSAYAFSDAFARHAGKRPGAVRADASPNVRRPAAKR